MEVVGIVQLVSMLLVALVGLAALSNRLSLPPPLVLVPAGVVLGFIPWFPDIELDPDVVLFVFLPPLIYAGGLYGSWPMARQNLRPILLLSVGLVLFTMMCVAAVAHYLIPDMGWPLAFVLGAILGPTDDVAAAAIARRFSLPRRIVGVLEEEALFNDAAALTALKLAVVAVISGSFSFERAGLTFAAMAAGEIVYGLVLGWIMVKVRRHLKDPTLEIAVSLLTPFLAYLPPEHLGGSGVLATAVAGFYVGSYSSESFSSSVRLAGMPIWQMLVFILNNLLFLITGLQLRSILEGMSDSAPATLIYYGLLVSLAVILCRIAWIFPAAALPRMFSARMRRRDPMPSLRHIFIISWTGMRGAISLAAALAVPAATVNGAPFPQRRLIIFITFCVIMSTLVLQGITLSPLIRRLGVDRDGMKERRDEHDQEVRARVEAARAALAAIADWEKNEHLPPESSRHMRAYYERQLNRLAHRRAALKDDRFAHLSRKESELELKTLETERARLLELRNEGAITDPVYRVIELDLDLQEVRVRQDAHLGV